MGWILCRDFEDTNLDHVKDLAKFPELRWLNRYHLVAPLALAAVLFVVGGTFALVWGFAVSTVLLWHGTFTINSLSHVFGWRRYETGDDSTNNPILALVTMGEGWHNNHHHYMNSTRQGFQWYQLDLTYIVLRALAAARIVWDLKEPPPHIVASPGRHAEPDGTTRRDEAPTQRAA